MRRFQHSIFEIRTVFEKDPAMYTVSFFKLVLLGFSTHPQTQVEILSGSSWKCMIGLCVWQVEISKSYNLLFTHSNSGVLSALHIHDRTTLLSLFLLLHSLASCLLNLKSTPQFGTLFRSGILGLWLCIQLLRGPSVSRSNFPPC